MAPPARNDSPAGQFKGLASPARTDLPPAPLVRTVNANGDRLFPQEAGPEGCASGECLPDVPVAAASFSAVSGVAGVSASAAVSAVSASAAVSAVSASAAVSAVSTSAVSEEDDEAPEPPAPVALLARPPASPAEAWRAAVDKVRAASPRHGASLAFGRLISLRPGEVTLAYPREAGFHRTTIGASTGKTLVEKILAEHFGRPTRMLLEEGTDAAARAAPSIAEQDIKVRADHEKSTDAKVRTHPAMRAVLKLLGGEIEHIQVLERERPAPSELESPEDGG